MKSLTDIQIAVRDSYENGEYQYVESQREADKVGDGFFSFLMSELGPVNCGDLDDAKAHLDTIRRELDQVQRAIYALEQPR